MTFWPVALFILPRKIGMASRPTNRKIRKTIRIAESETSKDLFSDEPFQRMGLMASLEAHPADAAFGLRFVCHLL